ncbi:hypothetical protein J437_LFUL000602 [Ladona fulva]|uniref:Threonyl/alanyl tRNA synthetase SAD domain-containing protein n=1 Tax=Ladona fulva TaxID=123851 RepID=A0A8K0P1R1_LADFU|nr:hypothetical protein J437_LFUL000602 [Ladona fulva]
MSIIYRPRAIYIVNFFIMIIQCQRNSFQREFTTTVKSCQEATTNVSVNGKKEAIKSYEIILEDTILFPEGGGQPSDRGWLDDEEVIKLERRGEDVFHSVKSPFTIGQTVKQKVDWELRFDRMQQHTGQHLVTAIADKYFGFNTTSWWLGDNVCHIELESATGNIMSEKEMKDLEKMVRTRGLPEGFKGQVRVVTISGVEDNMCCGTHLAHLGQLQAIKLLSVERGKARGGKTTRSFFLYFVAGGRVLSRLQESLDRETKLTALLKNGPPDHIELVDKLQKSLKLSNKNLQSVLKSLAVMEADRFKAMEPKPKMYSLHRKEAEADFMSIFLSEVGDQQDVLFFLTTGDPAGSGNMVLVCELLGGKGAGKGSRFQAKVAKLKAKPAAEEAILKFLDSTSNEAEELAEQ